jgi:hypothetical protein
MDVMLPTALFMHAPDKGVFLVPVLAVSVLVVACEEFTCADYATCSAGDAGDDASAALVSTSTNQSTTTDQSTSGASSNAPTSPTPSTGSNSTSAAQVSLVLSDASASTSTKVEDRDAELDAGPPRHSEKVDASESTQDVEVAHSSDASNLGDTSDSSATTSSWTSSSTPATSDQDAKFMNGVLCEGASQCESNFCVDGVCCDGACEGTCETCGSDGACTLDSDDNTCAPITCQASTACTTYPGPNTASRCSDLGSCITSESYCVPSFADVGAPCGSGLSCNAQGACVSACPENQLWCNEECVDPSSNDENCGECGTTCGDGAACQGGDCICPTEGEQYCAGLCIDVDSDPENCGGCDQECAGSSTCVAGVCRSWNEADTIISGTEGIFEAAIAASDSGFALVTWVQVGSSSQRDTMAAFFNPNSLTWSNPITLDDEATDLSHTPYAFAESDSTFVVVWGENQGGIKSRRWNGSSWSGPVTLGGTSFQNFYFSPGVGGHAAVTWAQREAEGQGDYQVLARRWSPMAHAWTDTEVVFSDSTNYSDVSATAFDGDGNGFAVWLRDEVPGGGSEDWGVWASRFDASDETWSEAQPIGFSEQRADGYELELTDNGDLLAYWGGRWKDRIWNASEGDWSSITASGDSFVAHICSLGAESVMWVGYGGTQPGGRWARWDDGEFGVPSQLMDTDASAPTLGCNRRGVAFAAWGYNNSNQVRQWSEGTRSWTEPHTFTENGTTLAIAVSAEGTAFAVRQTNRDESTSAFKDLVVERFQ